MICLPKSTWGVLASLFLAAASSAGASRSSVDATSRCPNVLFILTDQWRAQATGYAGDPNVRTPNLDTLAKEGLNFETAVSVCAVCTPYRAALQTGRFPLSTGMYKNDLYLDPNEYCMAEIFKDAGYNTAYVGKWHLDGHGRSAYIPPERRQGYEYWKVLECTHNYANSKYYDNNDPEVKVWEGKYDGYAQTKDAQAFIRRHAKDDKPFLFFLSFGGPHYTHKLSPKDLQKTYPPESLKLRPNIQFTEDFTEAQLRKELQGYYAHCTAIDQCVGDLRATLDELGIADNTILVFTSDHGEMMGSQGIKYFAKRHPYDEAIRVPFLLSYPKVTEGNARKISTPINTPDILPTLLSLAGIDIPDTIEGDDLSVLVKEPGREIDRAALTMQVDGTYGPDYRGIRTARYWYSEEPNAGRKLLFDCENDPYQMNNLVDNPEYAELQEKMAASLKAELIKVDDYPFADKTGYRQHLKRVSGVDRKGDRKKGKRKK
ncbi:Arylsulfatase [Pontiella desulfatans]|uniref:Arylsulfatase n=2 Tax=Pontiella desulfatans TaxID=2750659 RepID=A0A6C2U1F5_PONDE|nr:sulfatase S1_27 [Kiritimatiellales bacterium]VGO13639.1 Arylsulfatase [Pontiella desulfatans]